MVIKNKDLKNKNERYVDNKNSIVSAKLFKKTSIVGGMTLISRVLGLLRDVVFARYFGAKIVMRKDEIDKPHFLACDLETSRRG